MWLNKAHSGLRHTAVGDLYSEDNFVAIGVDQDKREAKR